MQWKTIALISTGMLAGIMFQMACGSGGGDSASASPPYTSSTSGPSTVDTGLPTGPGGSPTLPTSGGSHSGQTQLHLFYPHDVPVLNFAFSCQEQVLGIGASLTTCCPSGFTRMGWNAEGEEVCLED